MMTTPTDSSDDNSPPQDLGHWHLDKRVPIALIVAMFVQTCAIVWWASDLSARVSTLERQQAAAAPQADRLTRVEVKIENINEGISDIKRLLQERPR
jgi:hypothetical protein